VFAPAQRRRRCLLALKSAGLKNGSANGTLIRTRLPTDFNEHKRGVATVTVTMDLNNYMCGNFSFSS